MNFDTTGKGGLECWSGMVDELERFFGVRLFEIQMLGWKEV